jgi:predicted Zn-dependent protease
MSSDSRGEISSLAAFEDEAHALVERRRYRQARLTVARGLKHFPDSVELQYLAAFIDHAEDQTVDAVQGVKAVLAQAPQHYGARTLWARLLEDTDQLPQAEGVWIDLLREYPQNADCYAGYGELMLKTLNFEKARRLAQEGLRNSPEHAGCLFLGAMIDMIQNRRGAKSDHLQRLLREHPEQVRTSIALAVTLSEHGNNRGALRVAQEWLRHQPDSPHALELVRELKIRTHWSLLPLYPMQRWGWTGAIVVTVAGVSAVQLGAHALSPATYGVVLGVWLAYVIYSWTWPPLLRRWQKKI